jgi:hypothetical protein
MKNIITFFLVTILFSTKLFSAGDYPNSVFLGLGLGHNLTENHTEFSLMFGYDRHIESTPEISVGILGEGVFTSHNFFVIGVPVGFYPIDHLKLWLAPCFVYGGGGTEYFEDKGVPHFKPNNQFMLKFGAGYSIPLQGAKYTAMPFIESSVINKEFSLGVGVKFNMYFTDDFK